MDTIDPDKFVPAWSLRREREFDFCPRGYYLRYYAARGGHEAETADRRTRNLYRLRDRIGREAYLQRIVNAAMRELFYAPESAPRRTLVGTAVKLLREELGAMLTGRLGIRSHIPILSDLADPDLNTERLRRELEEKLRARCSLLSSGGWAEVIAIIPARRRMVASPLEVRVGELCCHTPAILAWQLDGFYHLVEGTARPPEGEAAELTALLHRYHALRVPGADAGRVRSLAFDDEGKLVEFGSDLEPGRALRRLREGFSRLRVSGSEWHAEDFPPNFDRCDRCVFQPECGAEKSASGD